MEYPPTSTLSLSLFYLCHPRDPRFSFWWSQETQEITKSSFSCHLSSCAMVRLLSWFQRQEHWLTLIFAHQDRLRAFVLMCVFFFSLIGVQLDSLRLRPSARVYDCINSNQLMNTVFAPVRCCSDTQNWTERRFLLCNIFKRTIYSRLKFWFS